MDGKACTVRSDCLSAPCQHGGLCVDGGPGQKYRCVCPDSYTGQRCQLAQERQTLKLGVGALCTIVGCLLLILCKWYADRFVDPCHLSMLVIKRHDEVNTNNVLNHFKRSFLSTLTSNYVQVPKDESVASKHAEWYILDIGCPHLLSCLAYLTALLWLKYLVTHDHVCRFLVIDCLFVFVSTALLSVRYGEGLDFLGSHGIEAANLFSLSQ